MTVLARRVVSFLRYCSSAGGSERDSDAEQSAADEDCADHPVRSRPMRARMRASQARSSFMVITSYRSSVR